MQSACRFATSCGRKHGVAHDVERRSRAHASKSSDRQVQLTTVACRDVATRSATPRSSSSSARTSADRCAVPRSSTRPVRNASPGRVGRLVHAAGCDHRVDRHGRRRGRLLNDHDSAAVEDGPDRRQPSHRRRRHGCALHLRQGLEPANRAIRRVAAVRRATSETSAAVTRATRACSSSKKPGPVTVSKYPSWCAMFVTLSVSKTKRARSCRRARADLLVAHAELADLVDLVDGRGLEPGQGDALHRRQRDGVQERLAPSARRAPETVEASDWSTRRVYSRAFRCGGAPRKLDHRFMPFAPVRTASSTSIGKKSGSVAAGACHASLRYAVVPGRSTTTRRSPICGGSTIGNAPRRWTGRDRPERPFDSPQDIVGVDVAGHDQRRVVRNVVAAIVAVQVVSRHRPQVRQPPDRRMPIGMRAKRHRRHLLIEELIGIVLAALQLGDDDRALRFALLGLVEPVRHAFGLDEQQLVERIPPGRFEVGRLVDPGVAVPHAAETLDEALHLVARDVARALEVHVLDPVRGTGVAGALIARADAIPAPDRDERCGMDLVHEHIQAVLELLASSSRQRGKFGRAHLSIIRATSRGPAARCGGSQR